MGGFTFKQFHIDHEQCAMKVGTDSIMLGSWVDVEDVQKVLDIGTGSGLLSIMMAQKTSADTRILGIDIDPGAIAQATENAGQCHWPGKLKFEQVALQSLPENETFDFIISNPPYFAPKQGDLSEDDPQFMSSQRRTARHTTELSFEALVQGIALHLDTKGTFACVVPMDVSEELISLCESSGLLLTRLTEVCHSSGLPPIRALLAFSFEPSSVVKDALVIRDPENQYTEAYRELCKAFYLHF